MTVLAAVLTDLHSESDELHEILRELPAAQWKAPTPAEGWTIAHQVSHLAWTDDLGVLAASDPAKFQRLLSRAAANPTEFVEDGAAAGISQSPQDLLTRWQTTRLTLETVLADLPDRTKLPWFGPPMAPTSLATARLMETWAHGLDIRDALGVPVRSSARLRHIAHLGVRTRGFSFAVNQLPAPTSDVLVDLLGPNGEQWVWGDSEAPNRISGPALDFCLLITQRRHRDDLALRVEGADAEQWVAIAQAFAGPPGGGRAPGPPVRSKRPAGTEGGFVGARGKDAADRRLPHR